MKKYIKVILIAAACAVSLVCAAAVIAADSGYASSSAIAKTVYCDVDHDGYVSTGDAIKIMNHSIGKKLISADKLNAAGMSADEMNLKTAIKAMRISISGKIVRVSGASVGTKSKSLELGECFNLNAAVKPSNATNKYFSYQTSDKSVASVDSNGKVTALKAGTACITAKSVDGGFSAKCNITVSELGTGNTLSFANVSYKLCDNYSDKYLYDQGDYKQFVQDGENVGCSSTSEAIGASMYYGEMITPDDPMIGWTEYGASFPLAKYRYADCSLNEKLKIIYNQLQKGNPSIINTENGSQHWVTVIGVRSGANKNNLSASDFLIANPWGGALDNFGDYLNRTGRYVPDEYSLRTYEQE